MRALAQDRYGASGVLRFVELPEPTPGTHDVIVAVHAASLNPADWNLRSGRARLLVTSRFPLVLGSDFAGTIVAVGAEVTRFRPGDAVFGACPPDRIGALAERLAVDERLLAMKPPNLTFAEAASLPIVAQTAWQALFEVAELRPSERVLIVGASGGVGTIAVQLAAMHGAHVTATCGERNLELVRSLGAADVRSYRDGARFTGEHDVVLDAIGGAERLRAFAALARGGRFVSITGIPTAAAVTRFGVGRPLRMLFDALSFRERRAALRKSATYSYFFVEPSGERMQKIADAAARRAIRPIVEEVMPFDRAIEALDRVEAGHVTGKIVVAVRGGEDQASSGAR